NRADLVLLRPQRAVLENHPWARTGQQRPHDPMPPPSALRLAVRTATSRTTPQTLAVNGQRPERPRRGDHTLAPHLGPHALHHHLADFWELPLRQHPLEGGIWHRPQRQLPHP